jgi:hypothetical protein
MNLLTERKDGLRRESVKMRDFSPRPDNNVVLSGDTLRMSDRAQNEWLKRLQVPRPYYNRLEHDKQVTVQEWSMSASELADEPVYPMIINHEIVGWSDKVRPIVHLADAFEVMHAEVDRATKGGDSARLIGGTTYSQDTIVDEMGGTFSWVTESLNIEPRVGDTTCGGVRLVMSDWLIGEPQLTQFGHRLVCSNGMTLPYSMANFDIEYTSSDKVLEKLREGTRAILNQVKGELLDPFAGMTNHQVVDPVGMAHSIARDRGMTRKLADRFIENVSNDAASREGGMTMYDIINCLTAVQNEDGINVRQRQYLQWLGGVESSEHVDRCTNCHHILA